MLPINKPSAQVIEGLRVEYRRTRLFLTILCDGIGEAVKQNAWYEDELPILMQLANEKLADAIEKCRAADEAYAPFRPQRRLRRTYKAKPKKQG